MNKKYYVLLNKAVSSYESIATDRDLKRLKLTLADYNAIPDIIARLQVYGFAETFVYDIAEWFRKLGFKVILGTVNYRISFS